MNSDEKKGRIWPIAIVLSIGGVVLLSIYTIMMATSNPVELSDKFMQDYQSADKNINDIIAARIAFDKHYTMTILPMQLKTGKNVVRFEIKDKATGKSVENASLLFKLARPGSTKEDIKPQNIVCNNGVYEATVANIPLEGRWDIMVKVDIGKYRRYYEYQADTRYPQIHPAGE